MNFSVCKLRKIDVIDAQTPLIVPSFSSKGIRDVGVLHSYLKEFLTDASLVSAYDLHYGFIKREEIYETEIVFIDSGGYERNYEHDLSNIYSADYLPKKWNMELYQQEIPAIPPIAQMVLVNFDMEKPLPLEEQVQIAKKNFQRNVEFASDFLCKPVSKDHSFIDVDSLCRNVHLLNEFCILGLTEKELGSSILDRCNSIYRIRLALEQAKMDIPIHIFGCIDPLNILIYFLCGADIFDGLSWLRFAFDGYTPVNFNSCTITSGKWHLNDIEARDLSIAENIYNLSELKNKMVRFVEEKDLSCFGFDDDILEQVKCLLTQVSESIIEQKEEM